MESPTMHKEVLSQYIRIVDLGDFGVTWSLETQVQPQLRSKFLGYKESRTELWIPSLKNC
jgi:hypothetical protein